MIPQGVHILFDDLWSKVKVTGAGICDGSRKLSYLIGLIVDPGSIYRLLIHLLHSNIITVIIIAIVVVVVMVIVMVMVMVIVSHPHSLYSQYCQSVQPVTTVI